MSRVALVTSADLSDGAPDDRPILGQLRARGIEPVFAIWNDPGVDWASFDMAVVRSPWDYDEDVEGFLAWTERAAAATDLWNRAETIRWNLDKRYLETLEAPVIDTVWIERGEDFTRPWERLVAKPAIDLGGRRVLLDPSDEEITALATAGDVMLQPFVEEVVERGELSLVFIDGRFEHAALKTAAAGEFRIQEEWGGTVHPVRASAEEVHIGERAIAGAGETLYARVDLIAGRVIEVELVEPSLFLGVGPGTAAALADAIERRLVGH